MHSNIVRRFKLSDKFIESYRDREVPWGPVGYVVFKRTYARRTNEETGATEEWYETCRRVIEGMFNIQKQHCVQHRLPWNDAKAQRTAKEAYERLFVGKWTPPGRGLWLMGTEFVEKHGSAALNNCSMKSTERLPEHGGYIFQWIMDALMLGVGVGFDTNGEGTPILQPGSKPIAFTNYQTVNTLVLEGDLLFCTIADSREGWVEATRLLLDSFFFGQQFPIFDYSNIRPTGAPIRGFGGVSSGSRPLELLHWELCELYSQRVGSTLCSVDIVDTENLVGKCIVSGNVRRSAAIAQGRYDDFDFLTMKNDLEKLRSHRWGSNNSCFAEVGMDYSWHAKQSQINGEPGYIWLENARAYGRIKDGKTWIDKKVAGFNPCFSEDTLIATADGRGAVPIKVLADEGKDIPVYSMCPETGMVSIKWGRNPRITGENQKLLAITLDDGNTLRVTPEHKFYLLDGTCVLAKDLEPGSSLPRLTKRLEKVKSSDSRSKYLRVSTNTRNTNKNKYFEHRLVAKFSNPIGWEKLYSSTKQNGWINGGVVVHHKDFNKLNNAPDNLEIMTWKEHAKLHNDLAGMSGENNPMFGKQHSETTRKLIGAKTKERWTTEEYRQKIQDSLTDNARSIMSETASKTRKRILKEQWLEAEKTTDLETVWLEGKMWVKKFCETCSQELVVSWGKREKSFCSISCANQKSASINSRRAGQKATFEDRQRQTLHNQVMAYKDLEESLGREPMRKEWQAECKTRKIPYRVRGIAKTDNPYALRNFSELKARAKDYNHRVTKVTLLPGEHTVYNITVDDYHTVGVVTKFNPETLECGGVYVAQCGEQGLEDGELCTLAETLPEKHSSLEDFKSTLKIAYLYAKTVTLVPTHWPETNAVMLRNRRIGLSMTGIIQAVHKLGRHQFFNWCDESYEYVKNLDEIYSDWLCVPRSIKMTTVKPSGSVSKLFGATPGCHYPEHEHYIQRIRFADNSPLLPDLAKAGYHIEPCIYSPNTLVVEFPIKEPYFVKSKADASMWEQMELAAQLQYYWSDNSVSITVSFQPEEAEDIQTALELYQTRLKTVSFLRYKDTGYKQAPMEPITKEEYEDMIMLIEPVTKFSGAGEEIKGEKYCTNDSCEIDLSSMAGSNDS